MKVKIGSKLNNFSSACNRKSVNGRENKVNGKKFQKKVLF